MNVLRFSKESLFQLELSKLGGESLGPQREEVRSGLEVTAEGRAVKEENRALVLAPESQAWAHHSLRARRSFLGSLRERFTLQALEPFVPVKVLRAGW